MIYMHPLYGFIFLITFLIWSVSENLGPVQWGRAAQGQKRDRGSLLLGVIVGVSGVVLALVFPWLVPGANTGVVVFFIGIGLIFVGAAWRWYAIRTLGKFFTANVVIQAGQRVIQSGPYRLTRHPSYAGVLLIMAGFGCMIGNTLSLVSIFLGMLIPLIYRMRVEERELLNAFGQSYQDYMQRARWRLIPFLF